LAQGVYLLRRPLPSCQVSLVVALRRTMAFWHLSALAIGLACISSGTVADDAPAEDATEAVDETKALLEQLTITMVSEVIDERTFEIRDSKATGGRKLVHIRLGNVAHPERGAGVSDEDHKAKLDKAKEGLSTLLSKQMIWFKPAPEEVQPEPVAEGTPVIVADAWLIDGRHINTLMTQNGHLAQDKQYETDLARNILSAEADEAKKDSYKKLEEALRESEKEKQRLAEEQIKAEKMKGEPLGFAGWLGLGVLGIIVLGALCNFGRPAKKKVNLNRKRGPCEKLWMKLKGA